MPAVQSYTTAAAAAAAAAVATAASIGKLQNLKLTDLSASCAVMPHGASEKGDIC